MKTYGEALQRALDLRAMGREPVATYNARYKADDHARRIGGEVTLGPMGFDVFASAEPEPERFEIQRIFTPAPAVTPGQTGLDV